MDLLHISKPSNQNTADSKIEKDLLDFWTPFQTLEDGVETPLSSNKYLSLPSGRRFSRRCSPLLNDPLKSPVLLRSQSGSYLENR